MSRNKPRSNNPVLDVVITFAGRFDMLRLCLNALEREAKTTKIGVFIIDNGSPAEERIANQELFEGREAFEFFATKRIQENVGFPRAANEGAGMGKSPLIMFLSDDVELQEGTLGKIIERMKDQTIGITGIKLIFPSTSTSKFRPAGKVQHVGMCIDVNAIPQHPLVGWNPENPKCCISREVWAVTGACLTVRRNLFEKVGKFDESFGIGTYEDTSLCMSVRQLGFKVFMDAEAKAYHYVGATAEKRQQSFPMQLNQTLFMSKWANRGLTYGNAGQEPSLSELDFW